MSVLGNYVILKPGVPKKLKISSYHFDDIEIIDTVTKKPKTLKRLYCSVIREDDQEVNKEFSTTSEKLAQTLFPFLERGHHLDKEVIILMTGRGYLKEFAVSWL